MAFWHRGDDPWDQSPDKRRKASERRLERERPSREEEEKESLGESFKAWRRQQKEKAAAREAELDAASPPIPCPWCGALMERGYLIGGRGGLVWTPGRPTGKSVWLGPAAEDRDRRLRVDDEGGLVPYKTVWYCASCAKMVIDAAGMRSPWESYAFSWPPEEDGEEGASQEEASQEEET